ncbi:MAG: hypothetical protein ACFE9S_14250 [Candidatus Hermodarchaeota archaeon]
MSEFIKYQSVFRGIIISAVITFIAYLIISIASILVGVVLFRGLFLFADVQFAIGNIVGIIYFIKNRQPDQSFLKYCIMIAIVGGVLSALLISVYQWILLLSVEFFLLYLVSGLISGFFVGLLVGVITSVYAMYKEVKEESPEKKEVDDVLKDIFDD